MTIRRWQDIPSSVRARLLLQRYASLWILSNALPDEVAALGGIPWVNVWNNNSSIDVPTILASSGSTRTTFVVKSSSDDVEDFSSQKFIRVYAAESRTNTKFKGLREFQEMQLKSRVATAVGLIVVVGRIDQDAQDIPFISDMAPQVQLISFEKDVSSLPASADAVDVCVFKDFDEFVATFKPRLERSNSNLANLKDADNLKVDEELLEAIEQNWTFLTADRLSEAKVTQQEFDGFLNGDPEWRTYSAGAAFHRKVENRIDEVSKNGLRSRHQTLTEILVNAIDEFETRATDPRNPLKQMRLFSEPGSGTTTSLRQAAVEIARLGYPVLISNPSPKHLSPPTVTRFIIDTQDRWRQNRSGSGSGHGNIPFVLLVDKDLDEEVEHQRLARVLASLGREAILIRAFERSRDEISRAKDILCLRADVSENDMLNIGAHLRRFSFENNLAPVPTDEEWRAYHQGLNVISHYDPDAPWKDSNENIPHLFLVGILPFISERIHDVNSLQQYYYQKWDSLGDSSLKQLVHTVAAAGAFGISVPYDSLRRIDELNIGAMESLSRFSDRLLDVFIHWQHEGKDTSGWYLRIRHPIVGRLLSRTIDPIEGDIPYKPLVPVLRKLTTKEDDIWFARNLGVRVGKYFKRRAQSFSLESDTPVQRAARVIFSSIPRIVKDSSRALVHHEARYHMHVLHACLDALENPLATTLSRDAVEAILADEFQLARDLLKSAIALDDPSEPEKFILNTYALLNFNFADSVSKSSKIFAERFTDGINLQEEAIGFDAADSLARYQFVHEIFENAPSGAWSDKEKLELYSRAEVRLQELIKINQEMTIKNIDPAEAELQIAILFDLYKSALAAIPNATALIDEFKIQNPESWIALAVRRHLGTHSLQEGFRSDVAPSLRELRSELQNIPDKSARSLLLLYRMFVDDLLGRVQYETRLSILAELKRKSFTEYLPYWHDEAALLCQLDSLQRGTARFAELRAFRRGQRAAQSSQWFWVNERALLQKDGSARLRQMALVVKDATHGVAAFHGTNITTRYQPYQFPELKVGQVFPAYIRFTLSGMQAVSETLARSDIAAMGLL